MTSDLPPAGGPNPASSDGAAREASGSGTAGPGTAGPQPARPGNSGPGNSGPGSSGPWLPYGGSGIRTINDFFAWIRGLGIYRPSQDRWGAGVAVGLARRWNIDPILVRGIFVALTFAGGIGVGLYGLAWLLLPQQDGRIHLQQATHGHFSAGFVGSVLLSLALLGDPAPGHGFWNGPPRFLVWLALVGLIFWIVKHHRHPERSGWNTYPGAGPSAGTSPTGTSGTGTGDGRVPEYGSPESMSRSSFAASAPPAAGLEPGAPGSYPAPGTRTPDGGTAPSWQQQFHQQWQHDWQRSWPKAGWQDPSWPSRRITRFTIGLALMAAAAVLVLSRVTTVIDAPAGIIAAASALGVVALGILVAGVLGRRSGGLAGIGILLMIGVLISSGVHEAGVRSGQQIALAGDYTWLPRSVAAAEQQYNLGAGQASLLLTDPRITSRATSTAPVVVDVRLGVGQLNVTLPDTVSSVVEVDLGAGQVTEPDGRVRDVNSGQHRISVVHKADENDPNERPSLIVRVRQGAGEVTVRTAAFADPFPAVTSSLVRHVPQETSHV